MYHTDYFKNDANISISDNGEFPTLLHFSACHGLSKLTSVLMDCSGSKDAIQMRNTSDMTPAELAHVNGHFDLANKLHTLHVDIFKESNKHHVYDYIQQNNYQIPPPPRPVHLKPNNAQKSHFGADFKDPYGTMRAEKKLSTPPFEPKESAKSEDFEFEDEVFIEDTHVDKTDKFGTLRANMAINKKPDARMDYRETKGAKNGATMSSSDELAITDEFLKLLEDFQSKNYSPKEMEMLFENWKRRADLQDIKVNILEWAKEIRIYTIIFLLLIFF